MTTPDRPRPIFRQSFTVTPPGDPDSDVTVQILVIADEDGTRTIDCPELSEAGWREDAIKACRVFVRVIG